MIRARRRFLKSLGATGALALTGCTTLDGDENGRSTPDVPIGTHYTNWLYPDDGYVDSNWTKESPYTPVLGNYDTRDEEVIDQHIEWATAHGVNWFWTSWWGKNHVSDQSIHSMMESERADDIHFSLLYETTGLLEWRGGSVVLDTEVNRERLRDHFGYFAEEFFDHPSYFRVDGRPVVFMYVSNAYSELDQRQVFDPIFEELDIDPYLIGDFVGWGSPTFAHRQKIKNYDAITTYNSYQPREDIDEIDFVDRVMDGYDAWKEVADEEGVTFIPEVLPGFNETEIEHAPGRGDNPVLSRDPERFEEMCERAAEYRDDDLNATFVTSWNEWFESTQIEPSEEEGKAYLEIIDRTLSD